MIAVKKLLLYYLSAGITAPKLNMSSRVLSLIIIKNIIIWSSILKKTFGFVFSKIDVLNFKDQIFVLKLCIGIIKFSSLM